MVLVFVFLPALIAIVSAQHNRDYCGDAERNASIPGGELNVSIPQSGKVKIECLWKIHTKPGKKVDLTILSLKLNDSSRCLENVVDIYFGETTKHAAVDRICCLSGGRTKEYLSTGYFIYVHLLMQTYAAGDGIFAIYKDVNGITPYQHDVDICGNQDVVLSNFKNPWVIPLHGMEAQNKQCRWILIAEKGKRVEVNFKNVNFDNDASCNTNKVLITDGVYENETLLGTICDMQAKKTVFTSSDRYMFVKLIALDIKAGKGFTAEIRQLNNARKIAFSEIWVAVLLMPLWNNYY